MQKAFDFVPDPKRNTYLRAIRAFQLQVGIVACRGRGNSGEFKIEVHTELMNSARIQATLKMLEFALEAEQDSKSDIYDLIEDDGLRGLLKRLVSKPSDLRKAGYMLRPQKLEGTNRKIRVCSIRRRSVRTVFVPPTESMQQILALKAERLLPFASHSKSKIADHKE